MFVTATTVQQLTEQTFANHVQSSHAVTTITNILHDVQMAACCFRYVHQIPAFFQRIGSRNFYANIRNTGFHGCNRHRYVPFPRAGNNHAVELFIVQHLFKFTFATFIHFRGIHVKFSDVFQCTVDRALLDIANSNNLISRDSQHIIDVLMAAWTCSDKSETQFAIIFSGCFFLLRFWRTCYCSGRSSTCHSQTCCTNSGGSHFLKKGTTSVFHVLYLVFYVKWANL